jgi:hypothetical protein
MSFMGGNPFEDLIGGVPRPSGPKKEEKGLPWEAKIFDGQYYVPLRQVAELLKQNGVLPKVREGIERRVDKGPPKPARDWGNERMNDQ